MAGEVMLPGYGGLTRFKEEYNSKIKFSPTAVVVVVILVIVASFLLKTLTPLS